MNKLSLSFATAMIATVAGGITLANSPWGSLASANAEPTVAGSAEVADASLKTASKFPTITTKQDLEAIATIYAHDMSGKDAATVYVRNIPVATFLGNELSKKGTSVTQVASQGKISINVQSKAMDSAANLANTINQLYQSQFDANNLGVKWDKAKQQYIIHAQETPIIAMNSNVMLPSSTNDVAEDALQITNRLRRQIGNVKPLKEIEGQPQPVKVAAAPTNVQRYQNGWASWYGPGFHGNYTANGERFNQYALTAAHRTLPFGTKIRVTNLDNGRSVVVTVNDRGPFIHNRVIDLSMGAAQVLGVVQSGVAPVSLDLVQ